MPLCIHNVDFSSVQSVSHVLLFGTPWTAAHQASLSITNSLSLLKLISINSVMPSNHLILCCPLLLLPSIFPSIRVFSNESHSQKGRLRLRHLWCLRHPFPPVATEPGSEGMLCGWGLVAAPAGRPLPPQPGGPATDPWALLSSRRSW